jgi:hypothetical protein
LTKEITDIDLLTKKQSKSLVRVDSLSYNEKNPMHAEDMYSILSGTAEDVSMLIDYLPSYLFPQDEVDIEWGVAGVSLGGHSSWLCLAHGSFS